MITSNTFLTLLRELTQSKNFCIAFSGGLDSAVLLHLLWNLRKQDPDFKLRALHVNHGLSSNSDQWEKTCSQTCHQYDIPIITKRIHLQKLPQTSLEALARSKRYTVFKEVIAPNEILVTAHHQNDQAETLLLQLFRGAGPKGLAAMPKFTPFQEGYLLRPLLDWSRQSLFEYAIAEGITWIEDESNSNIAFDRNFVRNELLPLIETRWPSVAENLTRAAKHCAEANHFIEKEIARAFIDVFVPERGTLLIANLLSYDAATQNYLIRYWLEQLHLPLPSTKKLALLQQEIVSARDDAQPLLCWKAVEVRRYDGELYAMKPLVDFAPNVLPWNLNNDLYLADGRILSVTDLKEMGLNISELAAVTIRFRRGGERCRLQNRTHTHALKKLFQAWRIPPWLRERIPLLYVGEELKAIIGYAVCD